MAEQGQVLGVLAGAWDRAVDFEDLVNVVPLLGLVELPVVRGPVVLFGLFEGGGVGRGARLLGPLRYLEVQVSLWRGPAGQVSLGEELGLLGLGEAVKAEVLRGLVDWGGQVLRGRDHEGVEPGEF